MLQKAVNAAMQKGCLLTVDYTAGRPELIESSLTGFFVSGWQLDICDCGRAVRLDFSLFTADRLSATQLRSPKWLAARCDSLTTTS